MFEPAIVIAGFPFPNITCTVVRILELEYALVSHKKQREKKNLPPRAQTMCLASFGPVIVVALPFSHHNV